MTLKSTESANIKGFSVKLREQTGGTAWSPVYSYTEIATGNIADDNKSSTLTLTPELLTKILANTNKTTCDVYIEYEVLAQPITIDKVEGGTITTVPSDSANVGGNSKTYCNTE